MKIKQLIKSEQELKLRLRDVFGVGIVDFIARTKERREAVIKNRLYTVLSLLALLLTFILLGVGQLYLSQPNFILLSMYLLGLSTTIVLFAQKWYREHKALTGELNLALVPIITACFERQVLYTHDAEHRRETEAMLRQSGLLPENYTVAAADDMFTFFEPYLITVRELLVEQSGSGKNRNTKVVFHGVLVQVTLPKSLAGETYISTEGDTFVDNDIRFWLGLNNTKIEETNLEWNQFESDFHVATSNHMEAREILTPDFMLDLHSWWSIRKENIRIVFKGNQMYMLLPDYNVRIGTGTTSADTEEILKYAASVLLPLWRTLELVEEVNIK